MTIITIFTIGFKRRQQAIRLSPENIPHKDYGGRNSRWKHIEAATDDQTILTKHHQLNAKDHTVTGYKFKVHLECVKVHERPS